MRVLEQRRKLLAALGALPAAFLVDILVNDLVPDAGAPLAQLAQLVLGILAFVVGTDPRVNSYAHLDALRLREQRSPFSTPCYRSERVENQALLDHVSTHPFSRNTVSNTGAIFNRASAVPAAYGLFGKRHDHLLRDIEHLISTTPDCMLVVPCALAPDEAAGYRCRVAWRQQPGFTLSARQIRSLIVAAVFRARRCATIITPLCLRRWKGWN